MFNTNLYTYVHVYSEMFQRDQSTTEYNPIISALNFHGHSLHIHRLYHAVEVYTGMYKTAKTGLETRAQSARVSKVSKVLCIPVYTDTAWYKVFMPCRCTARARTRAPWLRPRDSCTLCPAGSGVPDTTHEQTTYT